MIMGIKLDVKLVVNLTLDIHVLVLLVNHQYASQIYVEILFLEMANSAIMVIKLVAINVKKLPGYICSGDLGFGSTCTGQCGDGIKTAN